MRAIQPNQSGHLKLEGFEIYYETFGNPQARSLLLFPTWTIVHCRQWKMQVPTLARSFHVIAYDSPGNGGAERTENTAAFEFDRITDQGVGLLDYLGIPEADVLGVSMGSAYGIWLAAHHPDRVGRLVLISNNVSPEFPPPADPDFWVRRESYDGWQKYNAHYIREHYRDWLDFFFSELFSEAHSTKGFDDSVSWGLETSPEILVRSVADSNRFPTMPVSEALERIQCPVLLIHGEEDRINDISHSQKLAAARPDFEFVTLEGCGHAPHLRNPVKANLLLNDFLGPSQPRQRQWRRAMTRHKPKALYISSPIGLGHVQRDLTIARELRRQVPDLEIEWLAQHPVTRVLEEAGETIHPMSRYLASESAHWEATAGPHELNCFMAWRDMDEILLANFMLFLDVIRETPYDLWVGDEAWEVDYYLHENPELKTAPFVFLTDFLGWLPMDRSPDSYEALLTADYNAEMIEQVARYSRVRDRAIYIGEYDDLIRERFGPNLPYIPDWTRENFTEVGYITPFDPADYADTPALRMRLGYDPDQPLVIYAVGGTAIGQHLLRKAIDAWPLIHREQPEARCLAVAGPRIDPDSLPRYPGLEVKGYVHNLYEHLAAADLGVVQGGLTTTMELTLNRRPFIYFPLKNHCEQEFHVAHRLDRYGAGIRLDYAKTNVERLAEAALETLGADTNHYRRYDSGAAARVASIISELL